MIKNLLLGTPSAPKAAVQTLIGRATEIVGNVRFSGGLHIDGRIKGNVSSIEGEPATLSLSETGEIEGDVTVASVVVNGSIHGQLSATERLTLGAKARISGDVRYRVLRMEPGATVNGQLICEGQQRQEAIGHKAHPQPGHMAT